MNRNDQGELIRLLRTRKHYKQSDLAKRLLVSTDAVSKWELGRALPNRESEEKICQEFDLTLEDLHHPAATIARLKNETISESSEVIPDKRRGKRKKWIIICSAVLCIAIVGVAIFLHLQKKSESFAYYYHDSRYCYDSYLEEDVYERSCIYFGTFSDDNFKPFEDVARKEWLQDNSVRQDIKVLKLTFYKNAEAADAWEPTKCKVYLFRE